MKNFKRQVINLATNLQGWHTKRKILVLESDDWGSIRMPSLEVYNRLLKSGISVDKCHYSRYDSLASEQDIHALFDILKSVKNCFGFNPIITANCIVANPDFEKIKQDNYRNYYFETFDKSLSRYPKHYKSLALWFEGIKHKVFYPQFHGREHLNVNRWMKNLRSGSKETILAFENDMFGISTTISKEKRKSYMAAFDYDEITEVVEHKEIIKQGLSIFKEIFGYHSSSFIAPNGVWNKGLAKTLTENNVRFIQGNGKPPDYSQKKFNFGKLGNEHDGLIYLLRNVSFEPSARFGNSAVGDAFKGIERAFFFNKPAVISTHRVNYIGFINEENRTKNLIQLKELLSKVVTKWPEVQFLTSEQLGVLIQNGEPKV
jgi:hypothetical protein